MNFLRLIRYKNLLMIALTMFLTKYALGSQFIIVPNLSTVEFIVLVISILCITGAGYVINDIFDLKSDKINGKKILVTRVFSIKFSNRLYFFLSLIGLTMGIVISIMNDFPEASIYFIGAVLFLYLYSRYFKERFLVGNVIVSILCSLVLFLTIKLDRFGLIDIDDIINISIAKDMHFFDSYHSNKVYNFYIITIFLLSLIREVIKDLEDVKGDYNANYRTMPIILGIERTRDLVLFLSIFSIIYLGIFTLLFFQLFPIFIGLLLFVVLLFKLHFFSKLKNASTKKDFSFLSNYMKIIMFIGILSMGLFKFI